MFVCQHRGDVIAGGEHGVFKAPYDKFYELVVNLLRRDAGDGEVRGRGGFS